MAGRRACQGEGGGGGGGGGVGTEKAVFVVLPCRLEYYY